MENYDSVGILGGGSWGTTLAHLLGKTENKVLLWLRDKEALQDIKENRRNKKHTSEVLLSEKINPTFDLEEIAKRCEIIFVALPANSFREVVYRLGNHVKGDQILVSGSKGLEARTHYSMTEVIKEETCIKKIGVLAGPTLFQEILKGNPCAVVIASKYLEVIKKVKEVFGSPDFKVYGSDDVAGVELGGVIKNVIAIAAGIADGLGFGSNTKALIITRGISEMARIGVKFDANPLTFTGLAGVGDLVVTCSSPLSRNYRVGYHLAQGEKLDQILEEMKAVAEGINTAKVLHEYCLNHKIQVPIVEGVYQVLYEERPIPEVVSELMKRLANFEIDTTLFNNVSSTTTD